MVNLPRKLVYTDRTALSDFMDENELNREIIDVLRGILSFQGSNCFPVFSEVVEENALAIFNKAYYLCVLATNDPESFGVFQNGCRYGTDFHGMQVALVLLSLQEKRNEQMKKILLQFTSGLNELLQKVLRKFRDNGITFRTDFSPCPPAIAQLDVDWEKVTETFSRDRMVKIISLWKTKDERKKVLHRIWDAAGILQDGARYSAACAYLRMLDKALDEGDLSFLNMARLCAGEMSILREENTALKEENEALKAKLAQPSVTTDDRHWVRRVVDYAKSRHDWHEAKPFHEMLNHQLRGKGDPELFRMVDEIEHHFRQEKKRHQNIDSVGTFINSVTNYNEIKGEPAPKLKQLG